MKSERNKTIDMGIEEGKHYLQRCLRLKKAATLEEVRDKTLIGNCFEILPLLPPAFVDLLIVDPPYNLDKNFNGKQFRRSSEEVYEKYTESWIEAVKPLLKKTATIYVCCDWQSSTVIAGVLKRHFHIRNRITWQREKGRGALSNWKNGMEDIWFATNSGSYVFNVNEVKLRRKVVAPYKIDGVPKDWQETGEGNFRDTFPSNFWDDISVPYWSMKENTKHPTQKPEKLLAKLILASSNPGDLVLDPFSGSGSTPVSAKKLGRHYVGIEINEQYCVWAEKRLEMAKSDPSIQGYTEGVFWERNTNAVQKRAKSLKVNETAEEI